MVFNRGAFLAALGADWSVAWKFACLHMSCARDVRSVASAGQSTSSASALLQHAAVADKVDAANISIAEEEE